MRICFIVGAFPSLSETFILNQMTGLIDAGHDVMVYAGARSDEAMMHADVVRYGLLNRTVFYQDRPRSRLMRLARFLAVLVPSLLRAPGVVLRSLNVLRYGREALSLNLFFRARVFLPARDADVVLCHFGPNGLVGLQMKALGALRGKLAVAFHASDITSYVRRHGTAVYKDLFEHGDIFLPISVHAHRRLLELGAPAGKVRVHAMGVDVAAFGFAARRKEEDSSLELLSVSRLVEKKGLVYALEAVALLVRDGMVCSYTIVGDGPLRGALEEKVRALGIERQVRFAGVQAAAGVSKYLQQADVLLAPSIRADNGDEEGIPVVLMEAMASGLPVVTTLTGGVAELIVDGETGFVVPGKDAAAIAKRVRSLADAPELRKAVVHKARVHIEARHDSRRLNGLLADILSNKEKHGG